MDFLIYEENFLYKIKYVFIISTLKNRFIFILSPSLYNK